MQHCSKMNQLKAASFFRRVGKALAVIETDAKWIKQEGLKGSRVKSVSVC